MIDVDYITNPHIFQLLHKAVELVERLVAHYKFDEHFFQIRVDCRHRLRYLLALIYSRRNERGQNMFRRIGLRPNLDRLVLLWERVGRFLLMHRKWTVRNRILRQHLL
ncbi:hypothetical protein D3C78_960630 [compost metagenome]